MTTVIAGSNSMAELSGIFTFPSTGIWSVNFTVYHNGSSMVSRYVGAFIGVTTDNGSSWLNRAINYGHVSNESGNTFSTINTNIILDVTDTSNTKVRFSSVPHNSSITTAGWTDGNSTFMTFIRLGDT